MFEDMDYQQICNEHNAEYADWLEEINAGETHVGFLTWLEARLA